MTSRIRLLRGLAGCMLAVLMLPSSIVADGVAEGTVPVLVQKLAGSASFSSEGESVQAVSAGLRLKTPVTFTTGEGSTLDLFLGAQPGVVRLKPKTTLVVHKLRIVESGADTWVEVDLELRAGTLFGSLKRLSPSSTYEIRTPKGVAAVQYGKYRITTEGALDLQSGRLLFVHSEDATRRVAYTLAAPPAVSFRPTTGVTPVLASIEDDLPAPPPGPAGPNPPDFPPSVVSPTTGQ